MPKSKDEIELEYKFELYKLLGEIRDSIDQLGMEHLNPITISDFRKIEESLAIIAHQTQLINVYNRVYLSRNGYNLPQISEDLLNRNILILGHKKTHVTDFLSLLESEGGMIITRGGTCEADGDIAALLSTVESGNYLFLNFEEISIELLHLLFKSINERHILINVGKGASKRRIELDLPENIRVILSCGEPEVPQEISQNFDITL